MKKKKHIGIAYVVRSTSYYNVVMFLNLALGDRYTLSAVACAGDSGHGLWRARGNAPVNVGLGQVSLIEINPVRFVWRRDCCLRRGLGGASLKLIPNTSLGGTARLCNTRPSPERTDYYGRRRRRRNRTRSSSVIAPNTTILLSPGRPLRHERDVRATTRNAQQCNSARRRVRRLNASANRRGTACPKSEGPATRPDACGARFFPCTLLSVSFCGLIGS